MKYLYRCYWSNGLRSVWIGPVPGVYFLLVIEDYRKYMLKMEVKQIES